MAYQKIINGGLALGYGSKYQLLRMLGWHRDDFNSKVKKALNMENNIHWYDFKYDKACDKELLNLEFIPELDEEWKQYWACGRGGVNWDAVGVTGDGTYILVEAKAHPSEMINSAACKGKSLANNTAKIAKFIEKHKINAKAEEWLNDYYQLANRLVIADFLQTKGCKVKLLYVLFENGYEFNCSKKDSAKKDDWNAEIERELNAMKIKGTTAENLLNWCIINSKPE